MHPQITTGEIIAFDGKQSRNSGDEKNGQGAINTVSAWAASNRLVLGQIKVEGKSNEITALPELIDVLDLAGCIVTIDAMGCQREIVKKIVKKEADYVIAVKKNQPSLYEQIEQLFKQAIVESERMWMSTVLRYGRQSVSVGKTDEESIADSQEFLS